jgi:RNA polymerase sigma-70 factor (ECF subfamily)
VHGGFPGFPEVAWSARAYEERRVDEALSVQAPVRVRLNPFARVRSEPAAGVDDALVRAAQAGDRGAFAELYRLHGRLVHGILLAHAPRQEAEDLVQDVFLAALARMHTLREPAAFVKWIAAIARNRARMLHRGGRRLVALEDDVPDPAAAPSAGELRVDDVLAAIHRLPEAYREPLVLRLVEGMSGAEIAERTGLTPGSVRVNLHRGMKQLREELGGFDG